MLSKDRFKRRVGVRVRAARVDGGYSVLAHFLLSLLLLSAVKEVIKVGGLCAYGSLLP
jgi:hypothetical protein